MVWSRTLKLAVVLMFGVAVPVALAHSAGPSPGYTGAPGEFTCRQCHSTNPLNDGVGTLTIEGVPANYTPGSNYTITVRLQHPDRRRWGFQLTALTGALDPAGSFTITDATHTQIKTDEGRSYIEHRTAGTFAGTANGASWSVRWTAPAVDSGPIDFYACGNAANNNGASTGDNIYSTFVTSIPEVVVVPFVDVTSESGLASAAGGSAVAWADFDQDGDVDAFVARSGSVALLRNDAGVFVDVASATGLGEVSGARSASWGDFDDDGRPDLFIATATSARLFRNTESGFVDAGASGWFASSGPTFAGAWVDVDGDGRLDLFASGDAGSVLLHNDGTAGFSDVTQSSGLAGVGAANLFAWADSDGDGRADVAVTTGTGVKLFRQMTAGLFSDQTTAAELPAISGVIDLLWTDYDGDGRLDLVAATASSVRLFRGSADGTYVDVSAATGLAGIAGGRLAIADSDGDTRPELAIAREDGARLLRFSGTTFVDVTEPMGLDHAAGGVGSWTDADGDHHADLFLLSSDGMSLHENPATTPAIAVRAVTGSGRDALGATISLATSSGTATRVVSGGGGASQPPPVALFALPAVGSATVRVVFPGGTSRETVITGSPTDLTVEAPDGAPSISTVTVKVAGDGTRKLQVDGSGFATLSELIEVDGVALDVTKYPKKKRLGDGTSTRLIGTDSAFDTMVPRGGTVHVTTFHPESGVRSAPFVFVRD